MALVKPFLKWVDGKTQIIHDVLSLFPKHIHNYHEPFLGGGSVLLALLSHESVVVTGRIYASDINPHLIAIYKNIQHRPEDVIIADENEAFVGPKYTKNPVRFKRTGKLLITNRGDI